MDFKTFVISMLTDYQRLNLELKYELFERIPFAVGRGAKAKLFEEIARKYSVTTQCCRDIYYTKLKKIKS